MTRDDLLRTISKQQGSISMTQSQLLLPLNNDDKKCVINSSEHIYIKMNSQNHELKSF